MNQEITYKLSQIHDIIPTIWPTIRDYRIIVLRGGLGAGKTTFTKALTQFLNINETASSPTFTLVNEYSFKDENGILKKIFHSDWYRLKSEEEAVDAGMEDMLLQENAICIIEWPEKAEGLLPANKLDIRFEINDERERKLVISGS